MTIFPDWYYEYSLFTPNISGLIKQFLKDVDWGDLDYLLVDTPPGTSDEHLSIVQYLSASGVDGAVVMTTPQVSGRIYYKPIIII